MPSSMLHNFRYQRVQDETDEDESPMSLTEITNGEVVCKAIPWFLFAVVTVVYILHWYKHWQHAPSPCFDEGLLNAPIIWQEKTYMSMIDGDIEDIYSMHSPHVEAAWEAVRYEHITAITAEEMARLPGHRHTAQLYGPQEGHAVLLEVFHQIHCLDAIRKSYFGNWTETIRGFEIPEDHADHCFSYLLQMILCHADVGVMTTRWIESRQDFAADFNVTRQCRDFDVIKDWAEGRRAKYDTPGQIAALQN